MIIGIGIVEVVAITLFHDTITSIINVMIACFFTLFCCMVLYTWKDLNIRVPMAITNIFMKQ
jgi:hypothetical protein